MGDRVLERARLARNLVSSLRATAFLDVLLAPRCAGLAVTFYRPCVCIERASAASQFRSRLIPQWEATCI